MHLLMGRLQVQDSARGCSWGPPQKCYTAASRAPCWTGCASSTAAPRSAGVRGWESSASPMPGPCSRGRRRCLQGGWSSRWYATSAIGSRSHATERSIRILADHKEDGQGGSARYVWLEALPHSSWRLQQHWAPDHMWLTMLSLPLAVEVGR
jgi:hypothetical protein